MATPTISELIISIQTDLRNKLGITSVVGKVVINAFAAVQAAKLKIYYLANAFVYKNIWPDTADPESKGGSLQRFGFIRLGRYPNPAVSGEYDITIDGEIGAMIAPGTTFKSLDTSTSPDKLYVVDNAYTFSSTTETISIRALEAGSGAVLQIGDVLQVTAPLANIESYAEVSAVNVTATDAEDIESYRQKVIDSFRNEPQGGARIDYRDWTSDVSGIRTVYPYSKIGEAGVIDLYVEALPGDSTDGNGTPSASLLTDVENAIEPDKRPMGVFDINYLAVTPIAIDVEIVALSDSSFLTTIESAIEEFLYDIRPYIAGADAITDVNKDKLYSSDIYTIVRDIIGISATFTSITMNVDGSPEVLYQFEDGDIPYINSVTIP